ncbi:MAG: hypothetical protein IKL55_01080 [Clostridia bacterium]|nr:hypothetical protein [Clostridia bacterium]
MKKIISKILIIFIIAILMFEFCFSSNISYAMDISPEFINGLTSLAGGLVAYGIWFQRIIAVAISSVFNELLSVSFAGSCDVNWGSKLAFATPFAIFFNKYKLFDVNIFDITGTNNVLNNIRRGTASWFYIMRNFSASILLCILIYVGIRMAISTVAEDKAKYKKMFFDWCCSLALIFVLQYIAIFTIYANNAIVDALKTLHNGSDLDEAIGKIALQALMPVGTVSIVATFVYVMIVFQTISFMIAYMQRVLKVAFLLIISPLISITYSIDKMGDGKAQALNAWLKEFVYTILIQPFHCIIYMAFVNAAVALLPNNTILGTFASLFATEYNQLANGMLVVLCLKFVNDGEKAIRKIFGFQDDGNLTSMAAGAVVGIAVLKNAQKIGTSTIKGINGAKNFATALKGNIGEDAKNFRDKFPDAKFSNTKVGKWAKGVTYGIKTSDKLPAKALRKAGGAAKNVGKWTGNKFNSYKKWSDNFHDKLGKEANDPNKNRLITGAKSWLAKGVPTSHNLMNAMPGALGLMAGAMSYATGTSGAMEALGMGAGFQKGAEALFSSTLGTTSDTLREEDDKREEAQLEQEKYNKNSAVMAAATDATGKVNPDYNSDDKINAEAQKYANCINDVARLEELSNKSELTKEEEKEKAALEKSKPEEKKKALEAKYEKDGVLEAMQARAELDTRKGKEEFKKKRREKNTIEGKALSAKELEAKADTLLQAIMELKLKQKQNDPEVDSDMKNVLTDNDVSSAEKTLDTLKQTIDRSFVYGSGGSFDMSRMLQQEMGLEDDGSETYQSVVRAALDYRAGIANNRAEAVYQNWGKLNGTRDSLAKRAHNIEIPHED